MRRHTRIPMTCPTCRNETQQIGRSRSVPNGITRRYHCSKCHIVHCTLETITRSTIEKDAILSENTARIARQRGYIVPPDKADDWKILKRKGFTNPEAAEILKLEKYTP